MIPRIKKMSTLDNNMLSKEADAGFASRPHYHLLDGLRGVAALIVLWYHVFEGYAFAQGSDMIDVVNHGYLAVDFFFILSGFVISYAYDSRWREGFTLKNFALRRLFRLHPLVVAGAILGAVTFFLQGGVQWDGSRVATSAVMLALLCAMFMIPAVPGCSYEVRGNGEMYPLNGPCWSLFFEYIGNAVYALVLHKLPTWAIAVITSLLGICLCYFSMTDVSGYGSLGVGWTMDNMNFWGGLLRMAFPFMTGQLLQRVFRPVKMRGAFWICTIVLAVLLHVPYLAGKSVVTYNGVFECFCIAIVFPALVWLAASGTTTDKWSTRICRFAGEISYPLYIVHYPVMYLFYAWLIRTKQYTFAETWHVAIIVMIANIAIAYAVLRWYDRPVRRWLKKLIIT